MKRIFVFTDGSSRGNPGAGGFAAILQIGDLVFEIGGREEKVTNNQMELQALIAALSFLARQKIKNFEITIHTDSSYLLLGVNSLVSWAKNNWQLKNKEDVKNRDRWEKIFKLLATLEKENKIKWRKVAGHQGVILNERADLIATSFADGRPTELFSGAFADYQKILPQRPVRRRAHQRAYSYVSMINGKIVIHKTWAECEKRVKGKAGALFRKALDPADEKRIIEEWQGRPRW